MTQQLGEKKKTEKEKLKDADHEFVNNIQQTHADQRKRAVQNIRRQQTDSRYSLKARVKARKEAKRLKA